jgi:PAS domain-containing protein
MMAPGAIFLERVSDGVMVDTNLGFKELSGLDRGEVIGKTSEEISLWHYPKQGVHLIMKPFSLRELAGKVRDTLGKK